MRDHTIYIYYHCCPHFQDDTLSKNCELFRHLSNLLRLLPTLELTSTTVEETSRDSDFMVPELLNMGNFSDLLKKVLYELLPLYALIVSREVKEVREFHFLLVKTFSD